MGKWKVSFSLLCIVFLLTGCLYPQSERNKNQVPYKEQIQAVQSAVEQYQADQEGRLPIKTKDQDTPIYQKYLLDFTKIVPQYLAENPSNSFEEGGIFQYVLVDVETDPQVKIFDLRMAEKIREIKLLMKAYGQPPFKEKYADNVFTLNFEKLGLNEEPTVISPFTKQALSFVVTGDGEVYVDYLSDLYQVLQDQAHSYKYGDDIREILVTDSMFVPAYSLPYTIDEETNEPIFFVK